MDCIAEGRAAEYARWCVEETERKAPVYVKKQAAEWLAIVGGQRAEAWADEGAYRRICKLLRIMVHPDLGRSKYEGLEDYAWLLITAVLWTMDAEGCRY